MELEGEAGGEGRAIAQFRRLFLGRVSVYRPRDAASAASGSDVTRRDGRVTPSDRLGERPQRRRRATQRRGTFTLWTATRRRQRAAVAAPRAGVRGQRYSTPLLGACSLALTGLARTERQCRRKS